MLPTAALGLTCREAFEVLYSTDAAPPAACGGARSRGAAVEAARTALETQQDYDEVLTAADRWLDVWLHESLRVHRARHARHDVGAICDEVQMREAMPTRHGS